MPDKPDISSHAPTKPFSVPALQVAAHVLVQWIIENSGQSAATVPVQRQENGAESTYTDTKPDGNNVK